MITASLVLMVIGSIILVASFLAQVIRIYRKKTTSGIAIFSWVQNLIGRTFFVIYSIFYAPTEFTGYILGISQGLCGVFSIPLIYYYFRNRNSKGEYIKKDFRRDLFIGRVITAIAEVSLMIFAILARPQSNVIDLGVPSDATVIALSICAAFITSSSFIPQAYKVLKTHNTKNLSIFLLIFFIVGNGLITISMVLTTIMNSDQIARYLFAAIMASIGVMSMVGNLVIKTKNKIKYGEV